MGRDRKIDMRRIDMRNRNTGLPTAISRRDLLKVGGLAVAGSECTLATASVRAPNDLQDSDGRMPLNRFPRMVQEYFVSQVRAAEQIIIQNQAKLRTKSDAEAYVRAVQARISECFGPMPQKSPLKPRITGTVERDTYKIEKVIFESRPDFLVTANLYIPKGRAFPLPGVVGSCGHSDNGKASDPYQSFAQGLARIGYVVLIFDPIGQGERLQYIDADLKPRRGIGVAEHILAGNQQFLTGEFLGSWRAWDGIRALDYLLTRPEVDPKRVGITGNSGGGTMTTWLCGLERRWTMAAPGCFVTTFRRNTENELPADTEQCPPRVLALGLDHSDFLAAMAPKPVIILAKERDFFDVRGATEAYERLKRLYALLGAPDNIALHIGPTEHGYTQENREAMYRWFNRAAGIEHSGAEPAITIEKDDTLFCTERGQVGPLGSRTVFSYTKAASQELSKRRAPLSGNALRETLTRTLRLMPRPAAAPEFRILRPLPSRGYPRTQATSYAVETEPGLFSLVLKLGDKQHLSRPPKGNGPALLYVSHQSADDELRSDAFARKVAGDAGEMPIFACDVRGIGESRPDTCGADQFTKAYGSDYFYAIHSLMLDRPMVGQRAYDVLRVIDWLAAAGHTRVVLAAKGWGTLPALFAACLDPRVEKLHLNGAPKSYAEMAESEDYGWPLASFIPGVLQSFDLPDCYRALGAIVTAPV
jgi:cephalosporin-C deacetylase-like acetyl esterase